MSLQLHEVREAVDSRSFVRWRR